MRAPQSLDELIAKAAAEFADQLRTVAAMADKEEEIRIATERQLAFIEREAGIELEGRHEFTVAKGRIDSVYSRVIIEYKNPSSPAARIGPRADSPGSKKVVEQIKQRFRDLRDEHGHKIQTLFGVGFDGKHFIFVRFRDDKWDVQDPVEVNRHSAERFLWALFNLGQKGKPFSPEYLAGDFGAQEGSLTTSGVHAVDDPSEKIKKLSAAYGVPVKGRRPAKILTTRSTRRPFSVVSAREKTVVFLTAKDRRIIPPVVQRLSAVETDGTCRVSATEKQKVWCHQPLRLSKRS